MNVYKLDDFTKGWFIGDFSPSIKKTALFEAAVKNYKAGDTETNHVHDIATEYTIIAYGKVSMNGVEFNAGNIIEIKPGEPCEFSCIEDAITFVVKTPSVKQDKRLV